jgi:Glycosyltransferase Family 4
MLERFPEGDSRGISIASFLTENRFEPAVQAIVHVLKDDLPSFGTHIKGERELVAATAALIQSDPKTVWPLIQYLCERNTGLAGRILETLASKHSWSARARPFYTELTEAELAKLFLWLFQHYPEREPQRSRRARFLNAFDHLEHLRHGVLRHLVSRGTPAALDGIKEIAERLPSEVWLRWQIVDARREVSSKTWKRLEPGQVIPFISAFRPLPQVRARKDLLAAAVEDVLKPELRVPSSSDLSNLQAEETIELPSEPVETAPSILPIRILVIATEWKSAHGGLSTLNRKLCISLAELGHQVSCVVIDPSPGDIAEAQSKQVRLIETPKLIGYEDEERLILYSQATAPDFLPDIVIGHDHRTGPHAYHIAKRIYDNLPFVFFVHTLPEETELFKGRTGRSPQKAAEKAGIHARLCKDAQLIVAVGPRILKHVQNRFRTRLVEMRPGLDMELLQQPPDPKQPRSPLCLLLGRMEDWDVKGAELACRAIQMLNNK